TSAGGNDIFVLKLNPSGNFIWAKATGGSSNDFGYSMALDASGNVHATGYFTGTADFDPGAGTSNLTSTGGSDVFIQKLDASGNFVWAKAIGGTTNDIGYSISLASDGSVHTTGSFTGTVDFDPGADAFNITSTGSTDIFIHQLDASGNFTSAKQVGGSISDVAYSISLDAAENVYITGFFYGTVDFNPDTGTLNLTSVGASDIFFTKYCSGNLCSIILSNSVINATCGVCTDGSVDLTVSSGAFPLTYAWSTGAATEDISGLTNGTYYVTVTNSDGCAATDSAIVGQSCAFTMSFSTTHATCGTNNDGAVNMNINGAGSSIKENYTPTSNYNTFYSIYNLTYINDGDSTKGTIWGGGTPNPYELTMTFSSSVQLDSVRIKAGQFNGNYNKPVEMRLYRGTTAGTLLSTITPSYNYTGNSFANGGSNTVYTWEITPAASGYASILEIECYTSAGGVTYTYAWTGPNAFSATTQDISGLESGTYNVTATSNITGCPVNQSVIVIEESPNISLSFSKTNVTSNGGSDGAIDMTVNWSSALNYTATSNYSTFYSIYDLSYINDGDLTKGTIWGSGTPNPFELTMTFGSTYQIDSVRIRAGQFNGDYSKPQQMKLYRGTTAGTLLTTIIPSNSVTGYSFANAGTNTVYTWEITPATNGYASILEIECYSSSFSGTFTYSWTGPNSFTATTEDISALQAGTYYVTVTNTSNGCGKTGNTTITEPAAFTSQGETLTEINEPIETATQNVRLNVYPNPTNGVVNINIAGLDDESAILVIYDAFGSEVYRSIPQHIGSSYEHTWHFGNQLASGIYLLAIQT
ncbi:T9SS type A sorting domain-containing protein, partial [Bacteroidales bacterium AH-315-I05]|nr:T9SS type A sorting domain-containing protein [Bacteroidales bacterium AH-315-I05]